MAKRVKVKPLSFIIMFLAIICIGIGCTWIYLESPVNANDKEEIEVVIENGTYSSKIGQILKEKGLIKSITLFKIYLKVNNVNSLKASRYKFSKSMSLSEIVESLEKGVISNEGAIKITFKDGERITDYAMAISKSIGVSYEEVINTINDKEYIESLINEYWFLTEDILNEDIYYSLEGYLAPETYYFDKDSDVKTIIKRLLDQTETNLEKYKDDIKDNPHYYLTMASIVQLEGTNLENRKKIVGVFQNRLKSGMNMGSDVTTYYALQASMKEDLNAQAFATINPYNTRGGNMGGKMPVGPICNPNIESIDASVNPIENDFYFFVADKHGKIYFTKTIQEHNQKVAEIKANGDWIF